MSFEPITETVGIRLKKLMTCPSCKASFEVFFELRKDELIDIADRLNVKLEIESQGFIKPYLGAISEAALKQVLDALPTAEEQAVLAKTLSDSLHLSISHTVKTLRVLFLRNRVTKRRVEKAWVYWRKNNDNGV